MKVMLHFIHKLWVKTLTMMGGGGGGGGREGGGSLITCKIRLIKDA